VFKKPVAKLACAQAGELGVHIYALEQRPPTTSTLNAIPWSLCANQGIGTVIMGAKELVGHDCT